MGTLTIQNNGGQAVSVICTNLGRMQRTVGIKTQAENQTKDGRYKPTTKITIKAAAPMASCNSVSCERTAIVLIWRSVVMSVPFTLCCTFVLIFLMQSKELNKNICEHYGTKVANPLKLNEWLHLGALTKEERGPLSPVILSIQDHRSTKHAHLFVQSP